MLNCSKLDKLSVISPKALITTSISLPSSLYLVTVEPVAPPLTAAAI